jgi:hypothetical protein
MRTFLFPITGLMFLAASSVAQAKVSILVDKDNQQMTVSVDGVERYHWPVSTGNPSHETPNGSFRTFRMEADHFSKEFDDAPMPHSIFFTKVGHAIHGTFSEGSLGVPVSHGCVRISRANATTLFDLVKKDGVLNTTVTLTGSSRVALARNPRSKRKVDVARRDPAPSYQSYDAAGNPVDLTPQRIAPVPQPQATVRGDDGYIYPADGSSSAQIYPAPRGYRRLYDAQNVPQQRQYYGGQPGYNYDQSYQAQSYQPQVYAPQPYRPRGLFMDSDD